MRALVAASALLTVLGVSSPAEAEVEFNEGRRVGLELGFGGGWGPADSAYTRTLENFGFQRELLDSYYRFRFSAGVEVVLLPYLSVLLQTNSLGRQQWTRDSGRGRDDRFEWRTWTLDVHLRAFYPLAKWARVYVQLGIGPAFTPTTLETRAAPPQNYASFEELQVGYNVAGLGGIELLAGDHVGFFLQGGYIYAPTPKNEPGERHQMGGGLLVGGLSFRFGKAR